MPTSLFWGSSVPDKIRADRQYSVVAGGITLRLSGPLFQARFAVTDLQSGTFLLSFSKICIFSSTRPRYVDADSGYLL